MLIADWKDKVICHLIIDGVLAIHFPIPYHKFYFASITSQTKNVTREFSFTNLKDFKIQISFDGTNFDANGSVQDAQYGHRQTALGNYNGKAFIVGCGGDPHWGCLVKTELLDLMSLTWSSAPDFPYGK